MRPRRGYAPRSSRRTIAVPSASASNLAKARSRGIFHAAIGAGIRRSGGRCSTAARTRAATVSGVSSPGVAHSGHADRAGDARNDTAPPVPPGRVVEIDPRQRRCKAVRIAFAADFAVGDDVDPGVLYVGDREPGRIVLSGFEPRLGGTRHSSWARARTSPDGSACHGRSATRAAVSCRLTV